MPQLKDFTDDELFDAYVSIYGTVVSQRNFKKLTPAVQCALGGALQRIRKELLGKGVDDGDIVAVQVLVEDALDGLDPAKSEKLLRANIEQFRK